MKKRAKIITGVVVVGVLALLVTPRFFRKAEVADPATPPVVPKMTAAPVPMPKGISGASPSSSLKRMPASLIMVMISWVVSTRSTSGPPS